MDWFHRLTGSLVRAVGASAAHSKLVASADYGTESISSAAAKKAGYSEVVDYWQWETAIQAFTDVQLKRWLSLSRYLKASSGIHASASAPVLSAASYPEPAVSEKPRSLPFALLPSQATFESLKEVIRLNPFSGKASVIWPGVTLAIFLAPVAGCVTAAVLCPSLVRPAIGAWLVAEVIFLAYRAIEWKKASRDVVHQPIPPQEEVSQLLDRILALRCIGVVQPQEFLSGWFMGAPFASLPRARVKEFLAFGLYHRDLHELPPDVQAAVEENLLKVEERWQLEFESTARRQGAGQVIETAAQNSDGNLVAAALPEVHFEGELRAPVRAAPGCHIGTAKEAGEGQQHSFMAHTKEPLRAFLHPLALYAWGHIVGALTAVAMRAMGFRRKVCKKTRLAYYVLHRGDGAGGKASSGKGKGGQEETDLVELKSCSSQDGSHSEDHTHRRHSELVGSPMRESAAVAAVSDEQEEGQEDACVFVHGLGIGVTPYLAFIHEILRTNRHKAMAVVELPHLAFQLCPSVPTVDELVAGLEEVVEECAGPSGKASFVGHSYGSLVLAQYVRTRPSQVAALGLIDPVCILLCLPHVIYNFVYKTPTFDSVKGTVSDTLRLLLCSRELNVARALCRGFNWHDLHLWAHHMPKRTVVMLAGEDRIVPSSRVRRYLEANSIPVLYNDGLAHAQFLFRPETQKNFIKALFGPSRSSHCSSTASTVPLAPGRSGDYN